MWGEIVRTVTWIKVGLTRVCTFPWLKVGRNCEGVNRVSVLYDTASDLYGVEFGRLRGSQYKVLTKIDGVYCDQLQSVFTTHTGLETRI